MFSSKPKAPTGAVVGLDVGGATFYFHSSVLLQSGSSYFAEQIEGGKNTDDALQYIDEKGRTVYFIDRPPKRFEYVRDYLVTGSLNLPEGDIILRQNLREEAEFFDLKGLFDIAKVSRKISPSKSNKGILHWLGTERGSASYQNPYTIGAIHVGECILSSVPCPRIFLFASCQN